MKKRFLSFAAAVLLAAAPASAATISFDNIDDAGVFTYDASTGIASGSGILFDTINVSGAPEGDASYDCLNCVLSFTTTAATTNFVVGGLGFAVFETAGGNITMTGQVYTADGLTLVSSTNTVLAGSFSGGANNNLFLVNSVVTPGTVDGSLSYAGIDRKDEGFISELGLDNPFGFLGTVIALANCSTVGTVTTCDVTDADLANNNINPPGDVVPEPGSMILLGTGLFGLGASARRRFRRQ
jgi:hypothetical protein